MAYFSRQPVEEIVKVDTEVWSCENQKCVCWMRKNYICQTAMRQENRMLPVVE
jgi:hypothetical protein